MYLPLNTFSVWTVEDKFTPEQLFRAMPLITYPQDVIALGVENGSEIVVKKLLELQNSSTFFERKPYIDYQITSRFPSFTARLTSETIDTLSYLSQLKKGGREQDLFFEHLTVYREGIPVLPLLNYHDAFCGGTLSLSFHYLPEQVIRFAASMNVGVSCITHPELEPFMTREEYIRFSEIVVKSLNE